MQIKNKVAVVTGAGSGIGQAVAVELVRRQVRAIALVDQSPSVEETAGLIQGLCNGKPSVERYVGDVTLCDFRREVFQRLTKDPRRGAHLRPGRRHHAGRAGRENRQADRPGVDLSGGELPQGRGSQSGGAGVLGDWKWSPKSPPTGMRGN